MHVAKACVGLALHRLVRSFLAPCAALNPTMRARLGRNDRCRDAGNLLGITVRFSHAPLSPSPPVIAMSQRNLVIRLSVSFIVATLFVLALPTQDASGQAGQKQKQKQKAAAVTF